jgi:Ni,Fe-hydrogenase III small subunit/ferredoxin-like protein FixX
MTKWVWKGLRTGIKTTAYPASAETAVGVSPGRPADGEPARGMEIRSVVDCCPTNALIPEADGIGVDYRRCIHCFRCKRLPAEPLTWEPGYEWGEPVSDQGALDKTFATSLHIRIVDAGACGACLSEIRQITSPYYNIHRLGFFITPTPRTADVLLVAGPGTDHMRMSLQKVFEAMPAPKRVVAVGTCALTGGVFGPSFATRAGVGEMIPVDVEVPGCPPPPLAIIHALLIAAGRSETADLPSRSQAKQNKESL